MTRSSGEEGLEELRASLNLKQYDELVEHLTRAQRIARTEPTMAGPRGYALSPDQTIRVSEHLRAALDLLPHRDAMLRALPGEDETARHSVADVARAALERKHVDTGHLSVPTIIETYARRLTQAYPDNAATTIEERDMLLAWWAGEGEEPRPHVHSRPACGTMQHVGSRHYMDEPCSLSESNPDRCQFAPFRYPLSGLPIRDALAKARVEVEALDYIEPDPRFDDTLPTTMGHGAINRIAVLDILDDAVRRAALRSTPASASGLPSRDALARALHEMEGPGRHSRPRLTRMICHGPDLHLNDADKVLAALSGEETTP